MVVVVVVIMMMSMVMCHDRTAVPGTYHIIRKFIVSQAHKICD
jgi:hypothetical protein